MNVTFTNVITARIRRMGEGTVFSLYVSPQLNGGRGYPIWPMGGYPHPSRQGGPHPSRGWVPPAGQRGEYPHLADGKRYPRGWDWIGIPHRGPPSPSTPSLPPSPPPPPSGDRATERTLGTRYSVCLLRSRRRTFLFQFKIMHYELIQFKCFYFIFKIFNLHAYK